MIENQAQSETVVTADYNGGLASWEDDDPSVFQMEIVRTLQGEYQITNGYGQVEASKVLQVRNSQFYMGCN